MTSRLLRPAIAGCCGLLALSIAACAPDVSANAPVVAPANQPVVAATTPPATSTTADATDQSLTSTPFGPLNAVDRKLLSLVEQTSIRELTTSQWALERSSNPQVKEAAQVIITQHKDLETRDANISATLGLPLPDKPSTDMQTGIDRMRTETGQTFDDDYVNTLRQAHAEALILVSTVRADTQNQMVRPFAGIAGDYIKQHIELLEKTGDVDYTKLPVPQL